jgi:tetratricopeptide (TPR) repeat protein
MSHHLVELEQRALDLRNSGRLEEAAELFARIVEEQPDWEHGMGFYNLAGSYEDLGRLELAEKSYMNALRYEPTNTIFLGGLASFLYLYGDPDKAFEAHLKLLKLEKLAKHMTDVESLKIPLHTLGRKMGLSEVEVTDRINSV